MTQKRHILFCVVGGFLAASVLCAASLVHKVEICLCGGWARGWPFGYVSSAACSTAWQTRVFLTPLLLDLAIWSIFVAVVMGGVAWFRCKRQDIAEQSPPGDVLKAAPEE